MVSAPEGLPADRPDAGGLCSASADVRGAHVAACVAAFARGEAGLACSESWFSGARGFDPAPGHCALVAPSFPADISMHSSAAGEFSLWPVLRADPVAALRGLLYRLPRMAA